MLLFISIDVVALRDSYYGKPNLTTHYRYLECNGAEDRLTQCPKSSLSINVGKTQFKSAGAAGVSCKGQPSKLPCSASPPPTSPTLGCTTNDTIRLSGGKSSNEGRLEYCYNGQWSPFCTLRAQEATAACNELGFTRAICKNFKQFPTCTCVCITILQGLLCSLTEDLV